MNTVEDPQYLMLASFKTNNDEDNAKRDYDESPNVHLCSPAYRAKYKSQNDQYYDGESPKACREEKAELDFFCSFALSHFNLPMNVSEHKQAQD